VLEQRHRWAASKGMRNVLADLRAACLHSASTQNPAVSVLDSGNDSTLQVPSR
jgi:hypothetical protein